MEVRVLRLMGALVGEECIVPAGEGTRLANALLQEEGVHHLKPMGVPGANQASILTCFKFSDFQ